MRDDSPLNFAVSRCDISRNVSNLLLSQLSEPDLAERQDLFPKMIHRDADCRRYRITRTPANGCLLKPSLGCLTEMKSIHLDPSCRLSFGK